MRLFWVAWLVALIPGACRKAPEERKKPAKSSTLEVQDRGGAPRLLLRYRYRKGEELSYVLSTRRSVVGQPAPSPVAFGLSVKTTQLEGSRARLRWRVETVTGVPPASAQHLRGLTLWLDTSLRGEITTVSQGRSPRVGQLQTSVQQLYLAWPKQEVGVGARWQQQRRITLVPGGKDGGYRARLNVHYTFERIAPCGLSRCAHLSVRTKMALTHRTGRVQVVGEGDAVGQVVFDLGNGRILSSHSRGEVRISTPQYQGVLQRLIVTQTLRLAR